MPVIHKKKAVKPVRKGKTFKPKKKKLVPKKFSIDTTHPVEDGIMVVTDF
ncbi:hypothetical protein TNCT_89091, partial [Trichonephila clavata]